MQNVWYTIQRDSDTEIFCAIKFPVKTCENNCWFCSRLNGFIDINETNYKDYNQNNFEQCLDQLNNAYKINKTTLITFNYEVTFNHKYTEEFKLFFEQCVSSFNNKCSHIPNVKFLIKVADDNLLDNSVDLICKYLEDIFPVYNQLVCEKEIRCEYSFDFDSRFYSDARLNTFITQYNKMKDKVRDVYAKDYKISSNHFASILLPKTVRFVNKNWNNYDNSIIKFIKNALADGADLNFCLPFPMPLTVLQKLKNSYNFCDNYCYLTVEELRKFNNNLGIDDCPFIPQTIDNTELFYCNLNNGCPQKLYCKRYLLRNTDVNM